jgi:putative FmdB family regulatory protein
MPLYEYYCEDCDGVFELLRPVRDSSNPQPCPACSGSGERLMPTQVHAFTMRGGMPRRIPDHGLFWTPKGQSTKPMQTDDMKKMEPFLVKEERNPRSSTQLSEEERAQGKASPLEVRERVKGSKSRGRRLADRSESKTQ